MKVDDYYGEFGAASTIELVLGVIQFQEYALVAHLISTPQSLTPTITVSSTSSSLSYPSEKLEAILAIFETTTSIDISSNGQWN
jgi:hypothetical protein